MKKLQGWICYLFWSALALILWLLSEPIAAILGAIEDYVIKKLRCWRDAAIRKSIEHKPT